MRSRREIRKRYPLLLWVNGQIEYVRPREMMWMLNERLEQDTDHRHEQVSVAMDAENGAVPSERVDVIRERAREALRLRQYPPHHIAAIIEQHGPSAYRTMGSQS